MSLSVIAYLGLLAAVAVGRVIELRRSRQNQRRLATEGSTQAGDLRYPLMVALHAGVLAGSAIEVVALHRPLIPWLAAAALIVFILSNAVRWWAIRTLGARWNVQVMSVSSLGVAAGGPYRWVRHPNYAAVFAEMLALPLIHTAWIVAISGAIAHIFVLRGRVTLEESILLRDPGYRSAFVNKPRFLPLPWS